RPDHAQPVRAELPGRHRPPDAPAPVPRPRRLVLLPVGPLQRHRHRGGQGRRVRRLHDRRPRLGRTDERSVPTSQVTRARWRESVVAALADRLGPVRASPAAVLQRVRPFGVQRPKRWIGLAVATLAVAAATGAVYALKQVAAPASLSVVYLPAVL